MTNTNLTDAQAARLIARLTVRLAAAGRDQLAADLVATAQRHLDASRRRRAA